MNYSNTSLSLLILLVGSSIQAICDTRITNCNSCDSSGNFCLECSAGFTLMPSTSIGRECAACGVTNCNTCEYLSRTSMCTTCKDLKDGIYGQLIPTEDKHYCVSTYVSSCEISKNFVGTPVPGTNEPNKPPIETGFCAKCVGSKILSRDGTLCHSACSMANCDVCKDGSEGTVCLMCKEGFKLTLDGTRCDPKCKIANCITCPIGKETTECSQCAYGLYLSTDNKTCTLPCGVPNCDICPGNDVGFKCTKCTTGYTLSADQSACT